MANLSGIAFNKDVKENTGEFIILPLGKYQAVILRDELKPTKNGNGKFLELTLQIQSPGEFRHIEIIDRLNILNPSEIAQNIGQGTLKRICSLLGVVYPPDDSRKLWGKPMTISVKIKEFISNTTGEELQSNEVTGYSKPAAAADSLPKTSAPVNNW
jgi:hypothetical protein